MKGTNRSRYPVLIVTSSLFLCAILAKTSGAITLDFVPTFHSVGIYATSPNGAEGPVGHACVTACN